MVRYWSEKHALNRLSWTDLEPNPMVRTPVLHGSRIQSSVAGLGRGVAGRNFLLDSTSGAATADKKVFTCEFRKTSLVWCEPDSSAKSLMLEIDAYIAVGKEHGSQKASGRGSSRCPLNNQNCLISYEAPSYSLTPGLYAIPCMANSGRSKN